MAEQSGLLQLMHPHEHAKYDLKHVNSVSEKAIRMTINAVKVRKDLVRGKRAAVNYAMQNVLAKPDKRGYRFLCTQAVSFTAMKQEAWKITKLLMNRRDQIKRHHLSISRAEQRQIALCKQQVKDCDAIINQMYWTGGDLVTFSPETITSHHFTRCYLMDKQDLLLLHDRLWSLLKKTPQSRIYFWLHSGVTIREIRKRFGTSNLKAEYLYHMRNHINLLSGAHVISLDLKLNF